MTFHSPITAASPLALATAFNPLVLNRPRDTAVVTIRKAIDDLPDCLPELTLEQIAAREKAESVIATAKRLLSPAMYRAFLVWAERATAFSTSQEDDEMGDRLCNLTHEALRSIAVVSPLNGHDSALKVYLFALELADACCFGPLIKEPNECYTSDRMALDLIRTSDLLIGIEELSALAWQSDPNRFAWSVEVGSAITAEFAAARDAIPEGHEVELLEMRISALREVDEALKDVALADEPPLLEQQDLAEEMMLAVPPRSVADVLRKIEVMSARGLNLSDYAEAFLVSDLEALAGSAPVLDPFMAGPAKAWERALAALAEASRDIEEFESGPMREHELKCDEIRERFGIRGGEAITDPAARAEFDRIGVMLDRGIDLHGFRTDALIRLLLVPAPTPVELAHKLKLFRDEDCAELIRHAEIEQQLVADARRHARIGAHLQTDADLLRAFNVMRFHTAAMLADPEQSDTADQEIQKVEKAVFESRATTIEGAIAKLRAAYLQIAESWAAQHALVDPDHPEFVNEVRDGDHRHRHLWNSIENLARIARVDLSAPVEAIH